jgi:hypothetical protein
MFRDLFQSYEMKASSVAYKCECVSTVYYVLYDECVPAVHIIHCVTHLNCILISVYLAVFLIAKLTVVHLFV